MEPLLNALDAGGGVVCLVGAGGKKTTMYTLAALHPGRVALSSTSHMYVYDEARVDHVVHVEAGETYGHGSGRVIAFTGKTDTPQRVGGLSPAQIEAIWRNRDFDLFLIKADGARARWIKAPEAYEPIVPPCADTVIPVVSARVMGRRLEDGIAHRPERAASLMGITVATPIEPGHVARLMSAPDGGLKGVGDATVVPLINMVDDDALHHAARSAAKQALALTSRFSRVVLACMKQCRVVEVIERDGPAVRPLSSDA